jgi:hypothetical protein
MAVSYEKSVGMIGKRLRTQSEDITHAPLPRRWLDLILCLDEQERKRLERSQPEHTRPTTGSRSVNSKV